MTDNDNSEDDLGLDVAGDASDQHAAFIVGRPASTDNELRLMEEMHRRGGARYPAATQVVFTDTTDDGAEDISEEEALKWQKIMGWPFPPDLGAVIAYQRYQRAQLSARYWDDFQALTTGLESHTTKKSSGPN